MIELLDQLEAWRRRGIRAALARVVRVDGSGPRLPGAAMAVSESGEVVGSVSGGCVEGAVVSEALEVIAAGDRRLIAFGYSDDDAFAVGLTCGGTVHIYLEPFDVGADDVDAVAGGGLASRAGGATGAAPDDGHAEAGGGSGAPNGAPGGAGGVPGGAGGVPGGAGGVPGVADRVVLEALAPAVGAGEPVALATVVDGPGTGRKLLVGLPGGSDPGAGSRPDLGPGTADGPDGDAGGVVLGSLGNPDLDRVVVRDARAELAAGRTGMRRYGARGEARVDAVLSVFVESFAPPPRMVVIGAVDFTAALVRAAKMLSYRVTVCDARATFATVKRFPDADEVVVEWPHRHLRSIPGGLGPRDAVCVLSHDIKFDVPALLAALDSGAGYIGAMGSRRTHAERLERLREAGADDAALARVHSPIGLELGARTPEETAVAIVAEIVATRYRGPGSEVRSLRDTAGPIH